MALLVSLFALGHSITLIVGVLVALNVNPYLVDAVIGLFHELGLATKLRQLGLYFGEMP